MTARPFSEYREWLQSPEYKAQIAALVQKPSEPPRDDYTLDVSHLIRMHDELGSRLVRAAVDHFKASDRLIAQSEGRA